MSDAEPRLSVADLATIELMRTDSDYARYCEGVDDRVDTAITAKFPKGAGDRKAVEDPLMPRLIAQRAKLYCEEVLSIPIDRHVEKLRDWFVGLVLFGIAVLVVLLVTTAIGGSVLFFDEQKNANISWLLLLMLVMFLISLISMTGLVVMLVQWFRGGRRSKSADMCKPTVVLRCVWGSLECARRLMNLIWRRETGPPVDSMRHLKSVANRQSYFASAVSLLAVNVYMLLVTLAIWGALNLFLFTNNVGYQYPNSLKSPQERARMIAWLGGPVELIGRPLPTIDAIAWAEGSYRFDESLFVRKDKDGAVLKDKEGREVRWPEDEVASYKNSRHGEFRRQWSKFLLGCVLVWLIVPRILICFICGICVKCFYSDLLPDAEDDRVRKIVNQVIRSGEIAVSPVPSPPPSKTPEPKPTVAVSEPQPFPISQPARVPSLDSTEPNLDSGEPKSRPRLKQSGFRVVGYELEDASYARLPALARLLKTARVDQNLNGAREQMAFVGELDGDDRVVVVASLLTTADDSFREFVEDIGNIAVVTVVLTDGTAAREEYKDQPPTYELSLQAWRKMIRQAGLKEDDILAHDLINDRGVSLTASALDARDIGSNESGITIAGRHGAGIKLIHQHVKSLLSTNPPSQAVALQNLDEDMSRLYASEKRSLADRLKQINPPQGVQDELSKVKLPSDISGQCVRAAGSVCSGLFSHLPTRWARAGGLSGLAVGTVGGLTALASGGTAFLPMVLPIVLGHAISGAGIGGGFKLWLDGKASQLDTSETVQQEEANDVTLARCGVIQTLIYELQGNSESVISEEIGRVTNRLDRIDPQTSEKLLTHFAGEMKEMEGRR